MRVIVAVYAVPLQVADDAGALLDSLGGYVTAWAAAHTVGQEVGEVVSRALACTLAPPLAGPQALSDLETLRADVSGRLRQAAATEARAREALLADLARLVAAGMVAAQAREQEAVPRGQ